MKRARDQTAPPGGAPGSPRPGEDPWSYAPLPERRRRGPLAIGAAAAGGIALAAAIVFVVSRPRRAGTPPDARPPASTPMPAFSTSDRGAGAGGLPVSVSALPSPTPLPAVPPPPPKMPAREARSAGRPLPVAAPPEILSGDSSLASASPRVAAPARSSRTLLSGEVRPAERQRPPAAAARTYVGSLVAPGGARIELGGIVFSESPVALLNGRVLPVGGFIEGLRIVAIEENRVELSGEGFTAFLALK